MEDVFAIKCKSCGGPMYSNQAKRSFECAYCGASEPWSKDGSEPNALISFRHKPLEKQNDLLKLVLAGTLQPPEEKEWYYFEYYWRSMSLFEKILNDDPATARELSKSKHISIPCPYCGASFEGESTQSVFECPACGNKVAMSDCCEPGTFSKRLSIGSGAEYIPEQALPCHITEQQARANARQFVQQHADAFAKHDMNDCIDNQMTLAYLPIAAVDLHVMTAFPGGLFRKDTLIYSELINWAYPKTDFFDMPLLSLLEPWDYSEAAHFDPAMQEGDFRIAAVVGLINDNVLVNEVGRYVIGNDLQEAFGLNPKKMKSWARNIRKHGSGLMLVPVYYFDRPASDGREGEQVRMAVNGQTGRVATVIFDEKKEARFVSPLGSNVHLSAESTVHANPIEVRYKKSPHLYEIARIGRLS